MEQEKLRNSLFFSSPFSLVFPLLPFRLISRLSSPPFLQPNAAKQYQTKFLCRRRRKPSPRTWWITAHSEGWPFFRVTITDGRVYSFVPLFWMPWRSTVGSWKLEVRTNYKKSAPSTVLRLNYSHIKPTCRSK